MAEDAPENSVAGDGIQSLLDATATWLADAFWFNIFAGLCSILGLIISIYLLIQVSSVKKAQSQERERSQELFFLKEIETLLSQIKAKLTQPKTMSAAEKMSAVDSIANILGRVDGAKVALEKYGISDAGSAHTETSSDRSLRLELAGYYEAKFLHEIIPSAKKHICICASLNRRLAEFSLLESLAARARAGCSIELLSISDTSEDSALDTIRAELPDAPANVDMIRAQIRENSTAIVARFSESCQPDIAHRFSYKKYLGYSKNHAIIVDDTVYWGFEAQNPSKVRVLKDGSPIRPYLVMPKNSPLGELIVAQIEKLKETAITVELPAR